MLDLAAKQLGTVGGGNHYVDLFRDEDDRVWVGVHFGSRGFGHKTASRYFGDGAMDRSPELLPLDDGRGQEYVAAMELAGKYAYAGRDVVVEKVLEILGAEARDEVHNHHNYAWSEEHEGETLWVVRKGATPAFPGQRGFVGGSMADEAVILEGVDSPRSVDALYSTSTVRDARCPAPKRRAGGASAGHATRATATGSSRRAARSPAPARSAATRASRSAGSPSAQAGSTGRASSRTWPRGRSSCAAPTP